MPLLYAAPLSRETVRKNIILAPDTLYLDFTASGLAYEPTEAYIKNILPLYANTHSEVGKNAQATSELYQKARASLRHTLGVPNDYVILPSGTGTTGAIKKFQEITGLYIPPKTRARYNVQPAITPLVIVGPFEHHSNEISFRSALCETMHIPLGKDGATDLDTLARTLETHRDREIIASFSAASNVTGLKNPLERISTMVRAHRGVMCVDAATFSPHANIDASLYDALFLSPHKLIGGPSSSGLLVMRASLYDSTLPPTFAGGGTVTYVSRTTHHFIDEIETREDAGTPGIVQLVRAALAYELRNAVGLDVIAAHEAELRTYAFERFSALHSITLYSHAHLPSVPIFSFNINGKNPFDVARALSDTFGIQTRAGCSCAGPYGHDLLHLPDNAPKSERLGWVRAGFSFIHTKADVDYFFSALSTLF